MVQSHTGFMEMTMLTTVNKSLMLLEIERSLKHPSWLELKSDQAIGNDKGHLFLTL